MIPDGEFAEKNIKVLVNGNEIKEFKSIDLVEAEPEKLHMCLEAPCDLAAWRYMKKGDVCPYCGYIYL